MAKARCCDQCGGRMPRKGYQRGLYAGKPYLVCSGICVHWLIRPESSRNRGDKAWPEGGKGYIVGIVREMGGKDDKKTNETP